MWFQLIIINAGDWRRFLPVCVRVWRFKSKVSLNPLPQKVQRYLLTSLWHFMCLLRSLCNVKLLSQDRQRNLLGSLSHLERRRNVLFLEEYKRPLLFSYQWSISINQKSTKLKMLNKTHRAGGSLSVSGLGTSRARGFLTPCPPLISSRGVSDGIPS